MFKGLLTELVSSIDGAVGAIFLDKEGEAVEHHTVGDSEQLKLRAAYLAVMVASSRALAKNVQVGRAHRLLLHFEGARFLIEELEGGYFLMLELDESANFGAAIQRIKPFLEKLQREITG